MPCSEAEIEREFAHLQRLFDNHAQHLQGDPIEVRLTIMMNNLDVTREFMRGLSQVEHEVPRAPFRGSVPLFCAALGSQGVIFVNWMSAVTE
jgi:hypothetical protein